MSNLAKLSIADTKTKEYGFFEILGLKNTFRSLDATNPKRSAKVDYWIEKNTKQLDLAFSEYIAQEKELLLRYTKTFMHPKLNKKNGEPVEFIVYEGKDENDTLINDGGMYFRLQMNDGEPVLDLVTDPTYEVAIPSEEDGKEPTIQKMRYNIAFIDAEAKDAFDKKLETLQNEFKYPLELWKLDEAQLEGLQVMWKGREQDLTQFRTLLYENTIK